MGFFKHDSSCPTCQAYREFIEIQKKEIERWRNDYKETVQKLNDSMERESSSREKLENIILRVTRLVPPDTQVTTKPQPVQRPTWQRTRARLTDELEKQWKDKIETEQEAIRKLEGTNRDRDDLGETEGLLKRNNLTGT